jgi:hypothetical protein
VPTAYARVETDRPSRYLIQLCQHASQMGRMGHRSPSGHTGGKRPREVRHVDCSETCGTIDFAGGRWTLQATANTLTMRVDAADEDTLRQLQDGIAGRLQRIGRRDQLAVTWQRPDVAVAPDEQAPGAAHTGTGKHRRFSRLGTIGLVIGGALVVAAHLGLGGAALATSAWTGWATNIVLALILLKLVSLAGHVVLAGFLVRHVKIVRARRKRRQLPSVSTPSAELEERP